ncbi:hypothetical protein DWB61_05105 [Ancylomarina euxinus]|uniref:Tetratricopeptide repeat protein n=1 Tax=Ancylomarina euxinus TaxID=2283627 RepID=A0A425Y683_9BACT|nr:hypothetical protein [Ancylomarina euxinus]MCZ4694211.1 hypothetical protein [Ancylomarina euxinus]MUP14458.1 hypothetical protein [Ancylomarina euxinus]RRG23761.1 hypothetical protein DWB61_05105 [Ancylomarina euxinus]
MKKIIILVLFCALSLNLLGQYSIKQRLEFAHHLIKSNDFDEALLELNLLDKKTNSDSLHYLKGWSLYSLKQLESSAQSLQKVKPESSFYHKSQFFAAYNYAHTQNYNDAKQVLLQIELNQKLVQLKNFEISGIALLERDLNTYETSRLKTTDILPSLQSEVVNLNKLHASIKNRKPKKMWLAGLMSAVVPGSGKIYAGKTGEGIASMLMVTSTGLVTWENHRKLGIKNFKTILFGSIFTIFYVGNIYGSVFSVKISNEEFNHEMDQKILFNIHIPLRNIFN